MKKRIISICIAFTMLLNTIFSVPTYVYASPSLYLDSNGDGIITYAEVDIYKMMGSIFLYGFDFTSPAGIMRTIENVDIYVDWITGVIGNEDTTEIGKLNDNGDLELNDEIVTLLNDIYTAVRTGDGLILCQDLVQVKMRFSPS